MKTSSLFLIFILYTSILFGQNTFQKSLGSSNGDQGYAISSTFDGNYVIAGSYEADGIETALYFLTKISPYGDTLWAKTYGLITDTSSNKHATLGMKAYDFVECLDSGFAITGAAYQIGLGQDDVFMVRTDKDGDTLWTKVYGGSGEDYGNSIVSSYDNGFIIAGATESFNSQSRDGYILNINQDGDTLWSMIIGGAGLDEFKSISKTNDNNFIATGFTYSSGSGNADVWVVKFDSDGNVLWEKSFGGVANDYGNEIIKINTGFLIAGATESFGINAEDAYLIKIDFNGNLIWSKTYGTDEFDGFNSIISSNNAFVMVGYTQSFGNVVDILLLKTDTVGTELWSRSIGAGGYEYGEGIVESADGGYILTGYTNSYGFGGDDIYIAKTNEFGQNSCNSSSPFLSQTDALTITNVSNSNTSRNVLVKSSNVLIGYTFIQIENLCNSYLTFNAPEENSNILLYPNPTDGKVNISSENKLIIENSTIIIHDVFGNLVFKSDLISGSEVDLSFLENGCYFVSILNKEEVITYSSTLILK